MTLEDKRMQIIVNLSCMMSLEMCVFSDINVEL